MVTIPVTGGGTYEIDATEVTRGQYCSWLATNPSPAKQDARCSSWNYTFEVDPDCANVACQGPECADYPQACVDWCDAFAYCKAAGKRLCGKIGGGTVDGDPFDATQDQWTNARARFLVTVACSTSSATSASGRMVPAPCRSRATRS